MGNNKSQLTLKGDYEKAVYRHQEIEEYKNNPIIESLPSIFSEEDVIDKFTYLPAITSEDRIKPSNLRYHIIKRVKDFVQPLPVHIVIERRLSTLIRRGYLARNPLDKVFLEQLKILNELRDEVTDEKAIS